MKPSFRLITIVCSLSLSLGCGLNIAPEPEDPTTLPAAEPLQFTYDTYMPLALGGVLPGWDQIQIDGLQPADLVDILIEPATLASSLAIVDDGSAITYQITPHQAGIGKINYRINGVLQNETVKLVIPPQAMIQVVMGEARSIIPQEVTTDTEGRVAKDSQSPTAQALLSVVRNRIAIMEAEQAPYLFVVSTAAFAQANLAERYTLVITANNGTTYQFSPVNPNDPSYPAYAQAADRAQLTFTSRMLTYDQTVLTAAQIFDDSLTDNTDGAFGYYSPTATQYQNLLSGLNSTTLPTGIGTSDSQFPALAPIQILLLSDISPQSFDETLPSFVLIGARSFQDNAVIQR
ncbi:MAG: hypothetical protein HYU97_06485 [Deltaproteobacteria bacterium]|nr:hypothetical protein [Deltaproteobacteria bacterium]